MIYISVELECSINLEIGGQVYYAEIYFMS